MRLITRLHAVLAAAGQCSVCTGWFEGWPGGICDACAATGRQ